MGNKIIELSDPSGRETNYEFFCPGCRYYHSFRVHGEGRPIWQWNFSLERPTFTPSLLANRGTEQQCHLFVTDGKIFYLDDCWHQLRNQTVDMPDTEL